MSAPGWCRYCLAPILPRPAWSPPGTVDDEAGPTCAYRALVAAMCDTRPPGRTEVTHPRGRAD